MTLQELRKKIVGNEYLHRAIEVAITGNYIHSITIIGNPDNGKEYLENCLEDMVTITFIKPCPCGKYGDKICTCSVDEIREHRQTNEFKKAMLSDIIVQLQTPIFNDYKFDNIDVEGINLLRLAYTKFSFTLKQVERVVRVAKTISELEKSDIIKSFHIAEAIGYQCNDINI